MHLRRLHFALTTALSLMIVPSGFACETLLEPLRAAANKTLATYSSTAEPMTNFSSPYNDLVEAEGICSKADQYNLRGTSVDNYSAVVADDSKQTFRNYIKQHPEQPWRRPDGQPLNDTDFIAIDAVARTLVGEMGNEAMCGKGYMAAVARVLVNRAIMVTNPKTNVTYAKMFGDCPVLDRTTGVRDFADCLKSVALKKKQFSMWNKLPHSRQAYDEANDNLTALPPKLRAAEIAYGRANQETGPLVAKINAAEAAARAHGAKATSYAKEAKALIKKKQLAKAKQLLAQASRELDASKAANASVALLRARTAKGRAAMKSSNAVANRYRAQIARARSVVGVNDQQEAVTGRALCPKNAPTKTNQQTWNDAMFFAYKAVADPGYIKRVTPTLTSLWYTSGLDMSGRGWKSTAKSFEYFSPTDSGSNQKWEHTTLKKTRCIEFWKGN